MRRLLARLDAFTEHRAVRITQAWVIRRVDVGGRIGVSYSPRAGIGQGTSAA